MLLVFAMVAPSLFLQKVNGAEGANSLSQFILCEYVFHFRSLRNLIPRLLSLAPLCRLHVSFDEHREPNSRYNA
jgi:hypothetical protein